MKCSNLGHVEETNNDWWLLAPDNVSVYTIYNHAAIRNVEAKDMDMGFVVLIRPQYLRMIYSAWMIPGI